MKIDTEFTHYDFVYLANGRFLISKNVL